MQNTIPAGKFKQHCLQLMDEVAETHKEVTITKRGVPIAKIVPVKTYQDPFGYMKGSVKIKGDIISPIDVKWEALDE